MESKLGGLCLDINKKTALLIEPVWNRNLFDLDNDICMISFNRTSMESKPDLGTQVLQCSDLLIEPVWNRNKEFFLGRWDIFGVF